MANLSLFARPTGIAGAVARFEEWMADPESPVRAVRRQAAKPGVFSDFPDGKRTKRRRKKNLKN